MLYEIKFLKAPWPKGAKVGDVVDMPYLPAWAQGKCVTALDGVVATIEFEEPVGPDGINRPLEGDGTGQALPSIEAINAEIADLRDKLAAAEHENSYLQRQLESSSGAYNHLVTEKDAALATAADLRDKLAAAEQAAADAATAAANIAAKGAKK